MRPTANNTSKPPPFCWLSNFSWENSSFLLLNDGNISPRTRDRSLEWLQVRAQLFLVIRNYSGECVLCGMLKREKIIHQFMQSPSHPIFDFSFSVGHGLPFVFRLLFPFYNIQTNKYSPWLEQKILNSFTSPSTQVRAVHGPGQRLIRMALLLAALLRKQTIFHFVIEFNFLLSPSWLLFYSLSGESHTRATRSLDRALIVWWERGVMSGMEIFSFVGCVLESEFTLAPHFLPCPHGVQLRALFILQMDAWVI